MRAYAFVHTTLTVAKQRHAFKCKIVDGDLMRVKVGTLEGVSNGFRR